MYVKNAILITTLNGAICIWLFIVFWLHCHFVKKLYLLLFAICKINYDAVYPKNYTVFDMTKGTFCEIHTSFSGYTYTNTYTITYWNHTFISYARL